VKRYLISTFGLLATLSQASTPATAPTSTLRSGIDLHAIDKSVRAQDDFFLHQGGQWIKSTEIPADKARWGAFDKLGDDTLPQLRAIIEAAAKDSHKAAGSDAQRIGDFYTSFMDEKKLTALGMKPLKAELAQIAALKDKKDIPTLIAHLNQINVRTPYGFYVSQDSKDSSKYAASIVQSGLGMPDRDYYLKRDDAKLADTRAKYQIHIEKMLTLAGNPQAKAAADAKDILALETALAEAQWTRVASRDPIKGYNKTVIAKLDALTPGYGWKSYLTASGLEGKVDYVIVRQPSYLTGFNKILAKTPLPVWKAYFEWQLLSSFGDFLTPQMADEDFAFNGAVLSGAKQNQPRWKRAVNNADEVMGESIGKLYVAQHFQPEKKTRMEGLVKNLLLAYKSSIDHLDWMSATTKVQAQAKLATFTPKIGYPNKWRDYSAISIDKDDLVGNLLRARAVNYQFDLAKLGQPIDRGEWHMTPQTVNAYYNPSLNEIVFPASILQPPFFDIKADDAVNYGAIGAVIGHEISHGFDDNGSQYDGQGNLRDWWTKEDRKNFAAKTKVLVAQYNAFSPLEGYHVNGELTLGENIADNSGLSIAYKAYHLSLGGKPAPVIDGLSGDQRFFSGFAQVWRSKIRDEETISRLKKDSHSPGQFRANGTLKNQPGFYEAFGVKAGDKMYLPPEQRVTIW
jgi:putative endopeptidase